MADNIFATHPGSGGAPMGQISRRQFVQQSSKALAGAAVGLTILRAHGAAYGANDEIGLAVVGIHGRGQSHIDAFCGMPGNGAGYFYSFPTTDGLLPSIGWEGEREGIDDYKYVKMLEELIKKAGPDNPKAQKAKATLDKLRAEIPPDGKQVLLMPEAFTFDTFDSYRSEIANHIIALLAEVKE